MSVENKQKLKEYKKDFCWFMCSIKDDSGKGVLWVYDSDEKPSDKEWILMGKNNKFVNLKNEIQPQLFKCSLSFFWGKINHWPMLQDIISCTTFDWIWKYL